MAKQCDPHLSNKRDQQPKRHYIIVSQDQGGWQLITQLKRKVPSGHEPGGTQLIRPLDKTTRANEVTIISLQYHNTH